MSSFTEMVIVYALVAAAFLYVTRGWMMKVLFNKPTSVEEGCGACDTKACAACKTHHVPNT